MVGASVGTGPGKPAASAAVTAATASSARPITTMFRLTLTATTLPSELRADQLHRGFFITVPKYAKASLAFQNSVMASLRAVRFPLSMWGR
jgi:hypothetical protein